MLRTNLEFRAFVYFYYFYYFFYFYFKRNIYTIISDVRFSFHSFNNFCVPIDVSSN